MIFYHLVVKNRDDAIKTIDEECKELYNLKLKVHNIINRKLNKEVNSVYLNADQGKLFGYLKVFIHNILEQLWVTPEIMYEILINANLKDIKNNFAPLVVNFFYDNILSSFYMENNLLYLLTLLLQNEISKLSDISEVNHFLENTICGYLLDQLFTQTDIQVFFKATLMKTIEKLEVFISNRKLDFDIYEKEKELIKFKESLIKKGKKVDKKFDEIYKKMLNYNLSESFNFSRDDLVDNKNQIDNETFLARYIPDLMKPDLETLIKKFKEEGNNKMITYLQMQINEIDKRKIPTLFSNKLFMKNLLGLEISSQVLSLYQNDFSQALIYVEDIIKNLITNLHLLPYSIKSLCKIISILIKKKFKNINEIQKNAYISRFFFGKLLLPILSNPATNALISEFIISENTLHNLKTITNIIVKMSSGTLYEDENPKDSYYTPFNWLLLDKMPDLLTFIESITKATLPTFIDSYINDKCAKDYKYSYFNENPDEIVTHISICYNVNNIVGLLENIEKNKEKIFQIVNDPKSLFNISFQKLYKEENIEKIKSVMIKTFEEETKENKEKEKEKERKIKSKNSIRKNKIKINYFLFTRRCVNDKYEQIFQINGKIEKNFHIKEITDPKTKEEVTNNIIIKVKNYISTSLYNYRVLEKTDFEEGSITDTLAIFKELKRSMKSSNFIVDNSIPTTWYVNALLNYLKKLPDDYKKNDYEKLFKELKTEINNSINMLDFQSLILFHNKLKFLVRTKKHYTKAKNLVINIDINQTIKNIVEEVIIPVEVCFKYTNKEKKFTIEKSKEKYLTEEKYFEGANGEQIMGTIEIFTKKFPNMVRYQLIQGIDLFEMLKNLDVPKKLNDYFEIIKNTIVKNKKLCSQEEYDKISEHLIEYIMTKLYEKLYPQEPSETDSLTFKKTVMLSWAQPHYFITKKNNYIYDSFLPDVISHFKQIHREKTPKKKMECISKIFVSINNVIKFNDVDGECGADDSTSIVTYSLVQAQPYYIYSDIKYVELFLGDKKFKIEGNQIAQLSSACSFLCEAKGKNFNIDEDEFNKKCQEAMNNPINDDEDEED